MHNIIVSVLCLGAVGIVLGYVIGGVTAAFYALLALILLGWLPIPFLAIRNRGGARSVASLLKDFAYQVDHVRQALGRNPKALELGVLAAFDKLHAEITSLLKRRKIRIAQVKREVLKFHDVDEFIAPRWRPPTLSEMGYVLAAADKFSPDAAVLALYKFSGEGRQHGGTVSDTYTILKEGSSTSFSSAFPAKVQSPYTIRLAAPETAAVSEDAVPAAPAEARGAADSEHNVGYILSLLGPVTPLSAHAIDENLCALARLPAAASRAETPPAEAVWRDVRTLLTEPISRREAFLAAAATALRQAPQLFVCALADVEHAPGAVAGEEPSSLAALAALLEPADAASRLALLDVMRRFEDLTRALQSVPAQQPIANPGCAYVDARGAEADAGLLKRIAQLTAAGALPARGPSVHVVTNLTQGEFEARLAGYGELDPGGDGQAVIDTLLGGLDAQVLALHTVTHRYALKAQDVLGAAPRRLLILSVDLALVDMEGMASGIQYLLWTLSGRTLRVDEARLHELRAAALQIGAHAWQASFNPDTAAGRGVACHYDVTVSA